MTTEKQAEANRENAQLSTGPRSEAGKAVVARNAVTHGIFTRELIIEGGEGKEDRGQYEALFQSLVDYFSPQGQLEEALVEKIAVDFWRLRRVIRFETGSIRERLDHAIERYFSRENLDGERIHKSSQVLEDEIEEARQTVEANTLFLQALRKNAVDLTKPICQVEGVEGDWDLEADYAILLDGIREEQDGEVAGCPVPDEEDRIPLVQSRGFLLKSGYSDGDIKAALVRRFESWNEELGREIVKKTAEIEKNVLQADVQSRIRVLPDGEVLDKVLRYERSIEKAIFQKIVMLKTLQRAAAP